LFNIEIAFVSVSPLVLVVVDDVADTDDAVVVGCVETDVFVDLVGEGDFRFDEIGIESLDGRLRELFESFVDGIEGIFDDCDVLIGDEILSVAGENIDCMNEA
jgi:hypothetical protein